MRTSRIRRRNHAGFKQAVARTFASAMLRGAHQNARLRYGAEM